MTIVTSCRTPAARPRASIRKFAAVAAMVCGFGIPGGVATVMATAAQAVPLNCVADPDQAGCVHSGSEGNEGGDGDTGRAFLIDSEVYSMSGNSITVAYDAAEWASWHDFKAAVMDYWDIHSPWNRVCDFNSGCVLSPQDQTADRIVFKVRR